MHPYVHCSVIYNSQDLKAAQVSISRWVGKKADIFTQHFKAVKKEIPPFATAWMDLESIMVNEVSQAENDKYHMISLICEI